LPFADELLRAVLKDFIAFVIVNTPAGPMTTQSVSLWRRALQYPGLIWGSAVKPWISMPDGACLADAWNLRRANLETLLVVGSRFHSPSARVSGIDARKANQLLVEPTSQSSREQDFEPVLRWFARGYSRGRKRRQPLDDVRATGRRVLVGLPGIDPTYNVDRYRFERHIAVLTNVPESVVEWRSTKAVLVRVGQCPDSDTDFEKIADLSLRSAEASRSWYGGHHPLIVGEWYLRGSEDGIDPEDLSPINAAWEQYLGQPIIPYAARTRRSVFREAYRELKPLIDAHRAMARGQA